MYQSLYVLYKIIFACIQEETSLQTVFIKIIIIVIKIFFIESLVFIEKKIMFFSNKCETYVNKHKTFVNKQNILLGIISCRGTSYYSKLLIITTVKMESG